MTQTANNTISYTRKNFFRLVATLALGAAFVASVIPASAQSINQIQVDVPFAFTVGKKTLPAGEYTLTSRGANILLLRSNDNNESAIFTTNSASASSVVTQAQLSFNCYGEEYFLTEIRPSQDTAVFRLPRSKQEDRLAKSTPGGPEVVTLAANRK